MDYYSGYINQLIEQLSHLPGIGVKTAQRLAFHIMNMPADQAKRLADSITEAKSHVQFTTSCTGPSPRCWGLGRTTSG